jgi:parvulin-like peptidyl-prolyl isomerase
MRFFRELAVFGVALAGALSGGAPAVRAEIVDKVLAVVDTEAILLSDVLMEIGPALNDLRASAASAEEFDRAADKQVRATLDQAIENRILLREAQLAGIEVEDAQVEKRLEDYKKLFDSNQAFMEELERSGQTLSDVRARLRKQMLARTMAVRKLHEFEEGVTISESEVAQYYQDHSGQFQHPERIRCYQIFLPAGDDPAERARAQAQLEQLRVEIDAGTDFGELALAHSKAPGAEDGGLIGWVERGDLVGPLEEAAFALGEGEVSDVVETGGGFHLLRVDTKQPAGQASLEEVRKDIEPELRRAAATGHYKKWINELRKRSRVQVFL